MLIFAGCIGRFSFQSLDTFLKTQQEALAALEQQNQSNPQIHPNEGSTSSSTPTDNNNTDSKSSRQIDSNTEITDKNAPKTS